MSSESTIEKATKEKSRAAEEADEREEADEEEDEQDSDSDESDSEDDESINNAKTRPMHMVDSGSGDASTTGSGRCNGITGVGAVGAASASATRVGATGSSGRGGSGRTPSSRAMASSVKVTVALRSRRRTSRSGTFAAIVVRAISPASGGSV